MMSYLVVEGATEEAYLEALLPPDVLQLTQIVNGQGRSSAESLASTLLTTRGKPVGLLIDADTTHPDRVFEVEDTNRWLMGRAAGDLPYEVFVAVPTIEIVLLQDRELIERVLGHAFTDTEWLLGKDQPAKLLLSQLGNDKAQLITLADNLTAEEKEVVRQHELLQRIIGFALEPVRGSVSKST